MTSALIIPTALPAFTTAVTAEILEERDKLVSLIRIHETITDAETFKTVDGLNKKIIKLSAFIEEERVRLKRPFLDFLETFDEAFSEARCDLTVEKKRGGEMITAWTTAENARLKAIHDKQVADAAAAAAEAKRLQDEEAARVRAAAAAAAVPVDEEAPPFLPEPVPEPKVYVPTVLPPTPFKAVVSQSVKTTVRKKLVIDNPDLIPRVSGTAVLMEPNEAAIKKLIAAGTPVAGCRLVEDSSIGAK